MYGHVIKRENGRGRKGDGIDGNLDAVYELYKYMSEHNYRVIDLMKWLDKDGSMSVSRDEFKRGMMVSIKRGMMVSVKWGMMVSVKWDMLVGVKWGMMVKIKRGIMVSVKRGIMVSVIRGMMVSVKRGMKVSVKWGILVSVKRGIMVSVKRGIMVGACLCSIIKFGLVMLTVSLHCFLMIIKHFSTLWVVSIDSNFKQLLLLAIKHVCVDSKH